ncbi:MAG: hypothetical protein F4X20_05205 [Dehalococcoidia bacterium]|nr:hypothetical protein [Dehalococcoidia bacterium]
MPVEELSGPRTTRKWRNEQPMRRQHFGDNYDITKRFLMSCLAPNGPWGIIPMFTDEWSQQWIEEFECLLGGKVLITECIKATRRREQVTTAGNWDGHIFIDPDTGIRSPSSSATSTKLVRLEELIRESREHRNNIILVFDQSYANAKLPDKIQAMLEKLEHLIGNGVLGFGYIGQASFLVLSCDPSVLEQARENLLCAGVPGCRLVCLDDSPG